MFSYQSSDAGQGFFDLLWNEKLAVTGINISVSGMEKFMKLLNEKIRESIEPVLVYIPWVRSSDYVCLNCLNPYNQEDQIDICPCGHDNYIERGDFSRFDKDLSGYWFDVINSLTPMQLLCLVISLGKSCVNNY